MRNVSHKRCKENQNTHFMINTLFLKSCRLWDNVEYTVEPDGPQMTIWCMRIIPKATNTHSEYIILIDFHCNNGCTNAPQCCLSCYFIKGSNDIQLWQNMQIVIRNKTSADGNNEWFATTSESSALLIPKHHHTPTPSNSKNKRRSRNKQTLHQ